MSLGPQDVENIAHLARLAIEPADVPDYARDLSRILGLVEQMNEVQTEEVAPMAHPLDEKQRMRSDEVTEPDCREELMAVAPQVEAGLFLVPKVIE
jgi:aspartyl-tRNA(Asn)/glutamyl-tRNA(Gln) amidotransferase subunit C